GSAAGVSSDAPGAAGEMGGDLVETSRHATTASPAAMRTLKRAGSGLNRPSGFGAVAANKFGAVAGPVVAAAGRSSPLGWDERPVAAGADGAAAGGGAGAAGAGAGDGRCSAGEL